MSPQRIVLGGGVPEHAGLYESVRRKVRQHNNGYIQSSMILDRLDKYIVPPSLGNRSGGLGAIAMAVDLLDVRKYV
jgi:fructokinase